MLNEAYSLRSCQDENTGNYLIISSKDKINAPFKVKLLYIRTFYLNNPLLYLLTKFLIGLVLFTLPLFMFSFILKNKYHDSINENVSAATFPLVVSCILCILYIFLIIAYKILSICTLDNLYPTWDRSNMGYLIQSFIIFVGLFAFVFTITHFVSTFTELKLNLLNKHFNDNNVDSTFTKILIYDIFFDDNPNEFSNNISDKFEEEFKFNVNNTTKHFLRKNLDKIGWNTSMQIKTNLINTKNRKNDLTDVEGIIITEILNLINPVMFIFGFYFLRIVLFQTKQSALYLCLIFSFAFEFFYLKLIRTKVNSNQCKYFEIVPIIIFLMIYLIIITQKSLNFYKGKPSYGYKCRHNRIISLCFDFGIIGGIILTIYFFVLCLFTNFSAEMDRNKLNFLKSISFLGLFLIIVGNTINFGNFFLYLLFRPLEKQFFPAILKNSFYKYKTHKNIRLSVIEPFIPVSHNASSNL